jgi:hypothetical protein
MHEPVKTMTSDNATRAASQAPPYVIDKSAACTRPATIKALEYWRSRKGDKTMPSRADIAPSALRGVLPQIALVDLPGKEECPTAYKVRLAGDAILQVFGPLTGKPVDEILPPETLARWIACFDAARMALAPVRVTSRVVYQNKTWLQAEVLLAPLGQDDQVVMLLAAVDVWPANEV